MWTSKPVRVRAEIVECWVELLSPVAFQHAVTLTFDPKRVFPVGRSRAEDEVQKLMCPIEWMSRGRVEWILAVEAHRSGLHHAHLAVARLKDADLETLERLWNRRNGNSKVRPIDNVSGWISYLAKEAASQGDLILSDSVFSRLTCRPTTRQLAPGPGLRHRLPASQAGRSS